MLIRLAGLTVEVKTRYAYTEEYCLPYLAPEGAVADFTIEVSDADMAYEAARDADNLREIASSPTAPTRPAAPPEILENAALYRKLCHAALDRDILLVHGSALALDGVGYLFTAPSGTGKSTHTSLWRRTFGDRVVMVNDDKPLLCLTDAGVTVSGTPWAGKHHLSTPGDYPLEAICFLERGAENDIVPLARGEAYARMLAQTYRPQDPALLMKTLALLDRIMTQLKFYRLTCNISPEAAITACRGMGGTL